MAPRTPRTPQAPRRPTRQQQDSSSTGTTVPSGSSSGGGLTDVPTDISLAPDEIEVPLGVPAGYEAFTPIDPTRRDPARDSTMGPVGPATGTTVMQGPIPMQVSVVAPRYMEGDDYNLIRGWTPLQVLQLQEQLVYAGFLPEEAEIAYGRFDGNTASAFRAALGYANQIGAEWKQALRQAQASMAAYGTLAGSAASDSPVMVQLSDPAAIRQSAEDIAVRRLGRKPTANEQKLIVSTIHALQTEAQRAAQIQMGGIDDRPMSERVSERFDQAEDALAGALGSGGTAGSSTGGSTNSGYGSTPSSNVPRGTASGQQAGSSVPTIAVTQPDVNAQIEEMLVRSNPAEAGGADIANAFGIFEKILNTRF